MASPSPEERDALFDRMVNMIRDLEFCVPTNHITGNDTERCPLCAGGAVRGLPGAHERGCELQRLLADIHFHCGG